MGSADPLERKHPGNNVTNQNAPLLTSPTHTQTHDSSRISEMVEEYRRNQRAAIDNKTVSSTSWATSSCPPLSNKTDGDRQPLAYGSMGQELLSLMVMLQRQQEEQGRILGHAFDASSWKIKLLRLLVSERPALAPTRSSDSDLLRLLW